MSERKTIQINPELFKFPEKNSRKREHKSNVPKINMKSSLKKQKQNTLRKNVLKMIREKQQEEYKRLFDHSSKKKSSIPATNIGSETDFSNENKFNKDFNESLDFFSSLANKPENQTENIHNTTFKKYPNENPNSVLLQPNTPLFIDTPMPVINPIENYSDKIPIYEPSQTPLQIIRPKISLPPPPSYGCLKNGALPTYRNWHMQTQRNHNNGITTNILVPTPVVQTTSSYPSPSHSIQTPEPLSTNLPKPPLFSFLENTRHSLPSQITPTEIAQKYEKTKNNILFDKSAKKIKYLKQKKIFKRTYHVGRSANEKKIGVLVSNRTIRNRISTQSQLLKQTPIQDVRKFLIKKGFIKIGTNAPNDVLRKMYESISLVCGEIENHNPENLLFNFIHDTVQ